jgi:hypothetical protein
MRDPRFPLHLAISVGELQSFLCGKQFQFGGVSLADVVFSRLQFSIEGQFHNSFQRFDEVAGLTSIDLREVTPQPWQDGAAQK